MSGFNTFSIESNIVACNLTLFSASLNFLVFALAALILFFSVQQPCVHQHLDLRLIRYCGKR